MRSTFFDPGRMNARLELEAPVETPDGQGAAYVHTLVEALKLAFLSSGLAPKPPRTP